MSDQPMTEAPATSGADQPSPTIPKGSSVSEAASILAKARQQGREGPSKPPTHRPVQAVRAEEAPVEASQQEPRDDVPDPEPVEAPTEADSEVEATASLEDIPTSWDGLAEAMGVDPRDLAEVLTTKAKINGKEVDISVWEAVQGYQRQSDYDRRQGELAEQRKAFEAEREQIIGEAQTQMQVASQWLQVLGQQLQAGPSDAELAQMAHSDPDGYVAAKAHREQLVNAYNQVVHQQQAMKQHAEQQAQQVRAKEFESEKAELLSMARNKASGLPDLTNAEELSKFQGRVSGYLQGLGFSDGEIGQFLSPGGWKAKQIAIINDAMRYRDMMKSQQGVGEKIKGKPKVVLPKAGQQRSRNAAAQENVQNAIKRLSRTGSTADAQAVLRERRQQRQVARKQAR